MSLISDLAAKILQPIIDKILTFLGPFGKLFGKLGEFFKKITQILPKVFSITELIVSEIRAWKTFKEDIPFRTGVINLPKAIEQTQALIDEVRGAWDAVVDIIQKAKKKFQTTGDPVEDAEELSSGLEGGEGEAAEGIAKLFPKLAKLGEKLLGVVALLLDVLSDIVDGLDDLEKIIQTIADLRDEIEHGTTVFLQQGNQRKKVSLADGGSMNIRVGNLH